MGHCQQENQDHSQDWQKENQSNPVPVGPGRPARRLAGANERNNKYLSKGEETISIPIGIGLPISINVQYPIPLPGDGVARCGSINQPPMMIPVVLVVGDGVFNRLVPHG